MILSGLMNPPGRTGGACLAAAMLFLVSLPIGRAGVLPGWYGALPSTLSRSEAGRQAGWNVAVLSAAWDALEPEPGRLAEGEVRRLRETAAAFRAQGYRLQLDLGLQYPPAWVFDLPQARYQNQFGVEHRSSEPGRNVVNAVFNQAVRERMEGYMERVFREVGTDWDWVRLGGGFYGEVNFPHPHHAGKTNCYWGFDALAQGKADGLAKGILPCPVPGWIPGRSSPGNTAARQFVDWYLAALQNYHDWQIHTVRRWYAGEICMLYGSWGLRPGGVETAVEGALAGNTPAEQGGDLAMGSDWARMIGGISDAGVIVYCTWIDAPREHCDDKGADRARWSPVHWQASLAAANPRKLKVWGENTGQGTSDAMRLSFERVRLFGLMGLVWAFENELFADPNPHNFASLRDFAENIQECRASSVPDSAPLVFHPIHP